MSFRGKEKRAAEEYTASSFYSPKKNSHPISLLRTVLAIIVGVWVFSINYFERVAPYKAFKSCQWDSWETWPKGVTPHRIAIVADPQIVDGNTYPNQSAIFNHYIRRISDNYLKRNHKYMNSILDPDTTIFLGDLFDGGREWDDDVWFEEYQRFSSIFPQPQNRRTYMNLPGNHDIGFQTIDKSVAARFLAFFGEPNLALEIGNHTIVIVDTISLSHPDPEINKDAKNFVSNFKSNLKFPENPRILLTHVPLYRFTDRQLCGPLRERSGPFPVQRGHQYQTVLEYEISQQLLSAIDPDLVLSGDDHDYCDVKHDFKKAGTFDRIAREILVKTASMTCGVKYPAIQLLSLYNEYDPFHKTYKEVADHYQTKMCYLPAPYTARNIYIFMYLVSIVVLASLLAVPDKLVRWAKQGPAKDKDKSIPFNSGSSSSPIRIIKSFVIQNIAPEPKLNTFFVNVAILTVVIYFVMVIYGRSV